MSTNRTPIFISFTIVAVMLAASVWAWMHVPAGTKIPIHWGVNGQPNGFAQAPVGLFMAPAITALIALVFAAIPWLEPRRLNLLRSVKFYRAVWIGTILLMATTHGIALYTVTHAGVQAGGVIIAAVCLLLIVIGNYLGKTRSMFLGGVRTPWTLSSEYSWQRTHSLAGKLFVMSGALGFVATIALPPQSATRILLYAMAVTVVLSVVMSYVYWARDPGRHADDTVPTSSLPHDP